MDILFVGTERVGCYVAEIAGKPVEFTGSYEHISEVKELVIKQPYNVVIFDLSMFIDRYDVIADEIVALDKVSNARFVFYYLGKNTKSVLVAELISRGYTTFVLDSLSARANKQLQLALDGMATVDVPDTDETVQPAAVPAESATKTQKIIAVAGCCERIGTTTQAIQIVKYLQYLGHKACYVQLNNTKYVESACKLYKAAGVDEQYKRASLMGVELYADAAEILQIRNMDYDYLVYDFGSVRADSFHRIQFLEKDYRIIVGGDSPYELSAMQTVFSSPILHHHVSYIFSFVHENDFDDIRELMVDKADCVFFAHYTPDPFVYVAESNKIYQPIIGADNVSVQQNKKGLFSFFNR